MLMCIFKIKPNYSKRKFLLYVLLYFLALLIYYDFFIQLSWYIFFYAYFFNIKKEIIPHTKIINPEKIKIRFNFMKLIT